MVIADGTITKLAQGDRVIFCGRFGGMPVVHAKFRTLPLGVYRAQCVISGFIEVRGQVVGTLALEPVIGQCLTAQEEQRI